jgi:hypothetical protein
MDRRLNQIRRGFSRGLDAIDDEEDEDLLDRRSLKSILLPKFIFKFLNEWKFNLIKQNLNLLIKILTMIFININ